MPSKGKKPLWLRAETKEYEQRTPLIPSDAKQLVDQGHTVHVEISKDRIFKDEEYRSAGCQLVDPDSWRSAHLNAFILGLKELPEETSPLQQSHIYFAHAFKKQEGSKALLRRFKKGGGIIYDLEYLQDDDGRRVVTFGRWAGFVGAALALDVHCHQINHPQDSYAAIERSYTSKQLTQRLTKKISHLKAVPHMVVIGSKGRSGRGAVELFDSVNLKPTHWDIEETKSGGPFKQLLDFNIVVNCVSINKKSRPFLTLKTLEVSSRKLSVIADVTCDVGSPSNLLPIYDAITTYAHPTHRLIVNPPLDLIAIDHLPSLVPAESSVEFSNSLLPHLKTLLASEELPPVWKRAKNWFHRDR